MILSKVDNVNKTLFTKGGIKIVGNIIIIELMDIFISIILK